MTFFKSWQSYFYALLLHPTEAKVLMRSHNNNYFLPRIKINQGIWLSNVQVIKDAMEQELNIAVNVLYYVSYQVNKKQRQIQGVYVLEQHNPIEAIKVGVWCNRETLETLSFTNPEEQSIIEQYLIEHENSNIPKLRPPWARSGWFNEASTWIKEQLDKLEYEQLTPIEYVKSWSISCILKVQTSAGTLYLKEASTLPLFCDEPVVTRELANLFPNHIPNVISIDKERHWMLLADFGKPIGGNVSLKAQQDIYLLFAHIQIQSVQHCDRLLTVGCLDRRLDILQSQIDPLINDDDALSELSIPEIERLHSIVPTLKNLCSQLASYKIPGTLVHGDLHLGNVALSKNNYLLFDWTDSCISHPFFDLFELFFARNRPWFLEGLRSLWQRKSQEHLRDQYLSQWIQYESSERLLEAWNIAKPLCALHHTITYQRILASLETRTKQEFNSALPGFLRKIISSVAQLG
ncbi:MAG: phosphotransferase [Xenococcaceae cyanobacterium MO_207.B15]|nr:phosphotransferase [Xenococcaceae cyanobacterium MO_207.B15]